MHRDSKDIIYNEGGLKRNKPCRHLDLGLQLPFLYPSVELCYSSPRQLTQSWIWVKGYHPSTLLMGKNGLALKLAQNHTGKVLKKTASPSQVSAEGLYSWDSED